MIYPVSSRDNASIEEYCESSWVDQTDMVGTESSALIGVGTQTAAVGACGYGGGILALTEEYNGTSWTETTDLNQGRQQLGGAAFGTYTSTLAFAGNADTAAGPPFSVNAELWNGTNWTEQNNMATNREYLAGAGTATSALAFGGSPTTGATEEWTGAGAPVGAWATGGALNTGRYYVGHAGTQTAGLAVGGENPSGSLDVTELYDGTSWTEVNDLTVKKAASGSNGTQTSALFYGGAIQPPPSQTETWSGRPWTESSDINTARRL